MIVGQALELIASHIARLEWELAEVDAMIACHVSKIDAGPRFLWPKGSVLEKSLMRHETRLVEEKMREAYFR